MTQTRPTTDALKIRLDPEHPTPLYHQISQAIRWLIGRGLLRPGTLLPSLREAAELWCVSYHTVRRAYLELSRSGFVDPVRGDGTRVRELRPVRDGPVRPPAGLADFLRNVADEAGRRFQLTPAELGRAFQSVELFVSGRPARLVVVECNDHQCRDLARQIESGWVVQAIPWSLKKRAEPPPGPLVGTWFHYSQMRRRWPHRIREMHFAALRLDPAVTDRVIELTGGTRDRPVFLCERDIGTAQQHAADLLASLPFAIEPRLATTLPDRDVVDSDDGLFLIAPRLWDDLPEPLQEHPRVIELRHIFEPADLVAIGTDLGLEPSAPKRGRGRSAAPTWLHTETPRRRR